MGKYHLKAAIYAIRQKPENYISVKVADSRQKRKNIFANPKWPNSSFFAAGVAEVLLKKKMYVTRSRLNNFFNQQDH